MGLVQGVGAKGAKTRQKGAKKGLIMVNKCVCCGEILTKGQKICPSCVKTKITRDVHDLKILKGYYFSIKDFGKSFECRINDRNFKQGDLIHFKPVLLTGEVQENYDHDVYEIVYLMLGGKFGIEKGWCVFSIKKAEDWYFDFNLRKAIYLGDDNEDRK